MDAWILWLVAAAALGVGEIHTGGFYLLPFAIGATLAAVLGLLGVGVGLTIAAFFAGALIVVAAVRPVASRPRRLPPAMRSGAAALVGHRAMVLERIANEE